LVRGFHCHGTKHKLSSLPLLIVGLTPFLECIRYAMKSISMITKFTKKQYLSIFIASLVAMATWAVIDKNLQKTASRIVITGFFPADTLVTAYSLSPTNEKRLFGDFYITGKPGKNLQYQGTRLGNISVSRIELDFQLKNRDMNQSESQFSLVSLEVRMPYSNNVYFGANRITEFFTSKHVQSKKYADYQFDENGRAKIVSNKPVGLENYFLAIGLAALFFFLTWFVVESSAWSKIPAFSDMYLGRNISSNSEFNTINGVRGLAAILVLFSHTSPGFESLKIGLAILFVISGFLLAKPYVIDSSKIFSLSGIRTYLTKRIKRILPMYYLYIFIIYIMPFEFETGIRHFLFLQAEGHLWPMTQIFAFYMLLPFFLLLTSSAAKLNRFLPLILLITIIYFSVLHVPSLKPFYNGRFTNPFYLYAFIIGLLASYIQYGFLHNSTVLSKMNRIGKEILGALGLLIATLVILWSGPMKPDPVIFAYISQFYIKCILCSLVILIALNASGSLFDKIISNPVFRSVGVVGFSFYILHGLGMQIADNFALQFLGNTDLTGRSWEYTLGAFFVTYLLAVMGYSYVERPFFGYRRKSPDETSGKIT
jgi:peptidoglycan/LPS O-acetylase OafA/YrhL